MSSLVSIVLAAGKGTRMRSTRAKVLHEVGGLPMVLYPVRLARALGAAPVVAVTSFDGARVQAVLAPEGVRCVDQGEPLGTGHAVQAALPALEGIEGAALVLSGDVPLLTETTARDLVERHAQSGAAVTLVAMELDDAGSYGRVLLDGAGHPSRIVEARDASAEERASRLANAGVYVFDLAFLREATPRLDRANDQGEYYLTDLVAMAASAGRGTGHTVLTDPHEVQGINDRVDLAVAAETLNRRRLEALMRAGVTVRDPSRVRVDAECEVGADSVLESGVELRGRTRVGPGVHIDAGSVIESSEIHAGAHVKPYCVIEESVVGESAQIGPMAHLRPGSVLGPEVKIGNFVETKKVEMGPGSKASHLTYLGDAVIGADVNVGCGTITCNYDGAAKHRTEIGDGAFIGSDTQLVAPVKVGKGAYVGSGSTITKDVPDGALAVARGQQRNIEGWAARRRPKHG